MADASPSSGHRSGSDDFRPSFEFQNDNADDRTEESMNYDSDIAPTYFDALEAEDYEEEEEEEDEDYEDDERDEDEEDDEEDEEDEESEFAGGAEVYRDAQGNIQIEVTVGGLDEEMGEQADNAADRRAAASHLLRVLGVRGLQQLLRSHGPFIIREDMAEDDDGYGYSSGRFARRRRNRTARHAFPKVPSEYGTRLMNSGFYGNNTHHVDEAKRRKKKLATRMMWRELGIGTPGERRRDTRLVLQDMIPSSKAEKIIHYDARCYSGQFSNDGNFFFCCAQDFKVRMYDTSNPHDWKHYKTVRFIGGQWTITDATLSPDNKYLAISSLQKQVTLAPTDPNDKSEPLVLDFASRGSSSHGRFSIYSLRFSGDSREIVAGTGDRSVRVYDIETQQSILRLHKHEDDVNAVCYGDALSPHILYSGSDDTTIRVWDRRSMNDNREAGAFIGHTEGLTYVDSKGDGRYVLSNGKDQVMKLWDLRKMMTTEQFDKINISQYTTGYDYRYSGYSDEDYTPHPKDCSVVTYRGHKVLQTLIRCHFSPPSSTNSRYVYSGSADGKVYIYNIDATLAGIVDVGSATSPGGALGDEDAYAPYAFDSLDDGSWNIVRDASWHPSAPMLAATCWGNGGDYSGSCTIHSWNDSASEDEGSPPMGLSYDDQLNRYPGRGGRRGRASRYYMYDDDSS